MEAIAARTAPRNGATKPGRREPFVVMEPGDVPFERLREPWQTVDYERLNTLLVRDRKAVRVGYNGQARELEQWTLAISQEIGSRNVSLLADPANKAIYLIPRPGRDGIALQDLLTDRWQYGAAAFGR